jgi:cytochrome P450 family 114
MIDVLSELATDRAHVNPYPLLQWLRQEDPVHKTKAGFYLLSRHEDVLWMLKHTGTAFLCPDRNELERSFPAAAGHPTFELHLRSLLSRNPPDHLRLRELISDALTIRSGDDTSLQIGHRCNQLLDELTGPLATGSVIDLNRSFSIPLSLGTLCELLGIPKSDRAWLASAVDSIIPSFDGCASPDQIIAADRETIRIRDYFFALLEQRRAVPGNDLVSRVVQAAQRQSWFDDEDLAALLWGLWTGGFVPVAAAVNQGVRAMIMHPYQAEWLDRGHSAALSFASEVLRYDGIVLFTAPARIAVHDTRFGDRSIPAGAEVRGVLAAANRDPAAFDSPDQFLPGRDMRASLAFSSGPHRCPAANLAHLQVACALKGIRLRFPNLKLAGDPKWAPSARVSTITELPVKLGGWD